MEVGIASYRTTFHTVVPSLPLTLTVYSPAHSAFMGSCTRAPDNAFGQSRGYPQEFRVSGNCPLLADGSWLSTGNWRR